MNHKIVLSVILGCCLLLMVGCLEIEDDPEPDPVECLDPSDPRVEYLEGSYEDPSICLDPLLCIWMCPEPMVLFSNECGCGCIDLTPDPPPDPDCPDPDDPGVHYLGGSYEDPTICWYVGVWVCEEGQELFSDECGCGCIDIEPDPECPDPRDPSVEYMGGSYEDPTICWYVGEPFCEDPMVSFSNECGCGCSERDLIFG